MRWIDVPVLGLYMSPSCLDIAFIASRLLTASNTFVTALWRDERSARLCLLGACSRRRWRCYQSWQYLDVAYRTWPPHLRDTFPAPLNQPASSIVDYSLGAMTVLTLGQLYWSARDCSYVAKLVPLLRREKRREPWPQVHMLTLTGQPTGARFLSGSCDHDLRPHLLPLICASLRGFF